ncbi:prepilin peptidase [Orbaceae bacterium ESL0721]|nr:prepilin peptidase [Orbaceae bacterium ESL0721]
MAIYLFYSILSYILLFSVGASMGSFIYVAFCRFSPHQSVANYVVEITASRSKCPNCQSQLRYWQLIPLLSWLFLKGRCYYCHCKIGCYYPLIELLMGSLFLFISIDKGLNNKTFLLQLLLCWFLLLALIDFHFYLLPDLLTQPLMWLGLISAYFNLGSLSVDMALSGIFAGYLLLKVPSSLFYLFTKKRGLGGGDIKLLAALGGWIAYPNLPILLIIACLLGIIYYLILSCFFGKKGVKIIPFGPFLLLSGYGMIYFS